MLQEHAKFVVETIIYLEDTVFRVQSTLISMLRRVIASATLALLLPNKESALRNAKRTKTIIEYQLFAIVRQISLE